MVVFTMPRQPPTLTKDPRLPVVLAGSKLSTPISEEPLGGGMEEALEIISRGLDMAINTNGTALSTVCCFSQLLCACTVLASDRFISAPPFSRKLLGLRPWRWSFCVWSRRPHIQCHQSVYRSEVGGFFFFNFEAIQGTCSMASFLVYGV